MDLQSKDSIKIQSKNNCWMQTDLPEPMGNFTFLSSNIQKIKNSMKKKKAQKMKSSDSKKSYFTETAYKLLPSH